MYKISDIPIRQQRLGFYKKYLEDDKTFSDLNVYNNAQFILKLGASEPASETRVLRKRKRK